MLGIAVTWIAIYHLFSTANYVFKVIFFFFIKNDIIQ